jgi:2-polyprenyl-6-methoxyphenol hydroxylase-like FAD-dependent oxidoreductase
LSETHRHFDVAVVGLGPVGAAGAILFAEAGLSVAVIERDPEVFPLPRAVAIDGELVRAFHANGRSGGLSALLQPTRPDDRAGFANSRREWLFGTPLADSGSNGWPPMAFFHQPEVDGYLRDEACAHPRVTSWVGHALEGFRDTGDRVELSLRAVEGGAATTISADYLVACDGANSSVRRALGITWRDLGYDHDWLVVDVVVSEGHALGHDTVQVCDPDRLATYVCTKDPYRRWEFKLNPGETREQMLEPAVIDALIEPWTPKGTYEVIRSAVYQFHAATAETWRVGRVLLAGDAAHQTPPFLGQGMNAGMRDVVNLAWKLGLVKAGVSSPELLDAYPRERQPHAEDLVEWAVALGQLMEHLATVEAAQRAGDPPPPEPEGKRSAGYGQGREAPPLRAGVLMTDQVSDEGSTGYLFQHPRVSQGGGEPFWLDDLLGPGFALVVRAGAQLALSDASRALLDRIGARIVPLDDLAPVQGHFDRLFEQAEVAIVRPDRYVFGHTTEALSADELVAALGAKLALR